MTKTKIDLIEFSDVFRRDFSGENPKDNLRHDIVRLTREFKGAVTWYYGEYPEDNGVNRRAIKNILERLSLLDTALRSYLEENGNVDQEIDVILPMRSDDPMAEIISRHATLSSNIDGLLLNAVFRDKVYKKDLSNDHGPLNPEILTCLDEGYRGGHIIGQKLVYKWDREAEQAGQYELV